MAKLPAEQMRDDWEADSKSVKPVKPVVPSSSTSGPLNDLAGIGKRMPSTGSGEPSKPSGFRRAFSAMGRGFSRAGRAVAGMPSKNTTVTKASGANKSGYLGKWV